MSESILEALLKLFALIARIDTTGKDDLVGREIVKSFLHERLPLDLVNKHLIEFDGYLEKYQKISKVKNGLQKRTAVNSVKILRVCTQINEELTQRQKTIVLIRLLEFIHTHEEVSELEEEFISTVADTFNFDLEEFQLAKNFIEGKSQKDSENQNVLTLSAKEPDDKSLTEKSILVPGLEGEIRVLRIPSTKLHFIRYCGQGSYTISGQTLTPGRFHVLNQGASIRGGKIQPVYYSDIIGTFLQDNSTEKIVFEAKGINYKFKRGNIGLHKINLQEESGRLVGIMGASGSGKSTLLNVLNGNYPPSVGSVEINGINIHTESDNIEGLVGYVAQDDLLIDELTVFQNLFYNAKLSFGQKSEEEITEIVDNTLAVLGLSETRDLRVGNPLDKTISGGQRKRLNIALELIREPAVLFVDEPTSGLSSRDSENIMDLLKELSLKGKLIFVVIHQPSSDIFKMFDKLFVLDNGGFPIYYGNPVDSLVYFKRMVNHINCEEAECVTCGNVKTEDIFNIIESKVVDEFGNLTHQRKISPSEWNELYKEELEVLPPDQTAKTEVPESNFTIPGALKQFGVFITRDVLSKLSNRQYVLINLLEAPVLAMILAFFMRFFVPSNDTGGYVFRENENIPVYIFISVIVAIFIGLTVSSEEIIRDKKIRKRESFLNLSRNSYLFSKISIMLGISALQMLLFVLIGNYILEIKGMTLPYWMILFSACSFANLLGLNISASFNSAKVIYILIPIIIIPQLLFSGIIVKFDRLNPIFASQSGVPWIGNIMASRWAYEALAVTQFKWNEYERDFFELEKRKKFSNWKKDYWITELKNKANIVSNNLENQAAQPELEKHLEVIQNELIKENEFIRGLAFERVNELSIETVSKDLMTEVADHLDLLKEHYKKVYLKADNEKEKTIFAMTRDKESNSEYQHIYNNFKNDQLEIFATNRNDLNYIAEHNGELIQKKDLIYLMPYNSSFFEAHFYAPSKKLFGKFIDTFYANILVLWGMTLLLAICLFGNVFPKTVKYIEAGLNLGVKREKRRV